MGETHTEEHAVLPRAIQHSLDRIGDCLRAYPEADEARNHLAYLTELLERKEARRASLARLVHEVKSPQATLAHALEELRGHLSALALADDSKPSRRAMLLAGIDNPFWSSNERQRRHERITTWQPNLPHTLTRRLAYLPDDLLAELEPTIRAPHSPTLEALLQAFEAGTAWRTAHLSTERLRQLSGHLRSLTQSPFPVAQGVDLGASWREALTLLEQPLREHEVHLDVPSGLRVAAEALPLQQVWTNLLTNAAEALGPSAGRIDVTAREDGDAIVVSIADDGPGLKGQDPEKIFEAGFTTKLGTDRKGSGLGLAISRELIEQAGGQIGAEALATGGLQISLWLPRAS